MKTTTIVMLVLNVLAMLYGVYFMLTVHVLVGAFIALANAFAVYLACKRLRTLKRLDDILKKLDEENNE